MSQGPTRFEIAGAKDIMRLQEELDWEEAGVFRHVTKNEESLQVEEMQCDVVIDTRWLR